MQKLINHVGSCFLLQLRNYNPVGLVMVMKAEAVPKFRERLKSLLAES